MSDEKISPNNVSLESNIGAYFDPLRTRRLLRKMDWNIVPFLALLYLVSRLRLFAFYSFFPAFFSRPHQHWQRPSRRSRS